MSTALWRPPAKNHYALHLINELSTTGVRAVQHEDFVAVPAKATIAIPGVKKVKVVAGPRNAKVSRKGKAFVVAIPAMEERAIIECSF